MHDYDDINEILRRAFPQGTALLRHEHGDAILHLGARDLVTNARLALEVLGPRGARALGRALIAVGEGHVANGQRMLELADEKASGESKPDTRPLPAYYTEPDR